MPQNIFDYLLVHRSMPKDQAWDQHFEPPSTGRPSEHQPGTAAKMDAMRARLERGEPLWIDGDRVCFDERK